MYNYAKIRDLVQERENAMHSLEASIATFELDPKHARPVIRAKYVAEKVDAIEYWTKEVSGFL